MALKFVSAGSSNNTSNKPQQLLPETHYPKSAVYPARVIQRTGLFLDKLAFKAVLTPAMCGTSGAALEASNVIPWAEELVGAFEVQQEKMGGHSTAKVFSNARMLELPLNFDGELALLSLDKRAIAGYPPAYTLRVEVNPSQFGTSACNQLQALLEQAGPLNLSFPAFLSDAMLQRIDIATDLFDVEVGDLLVRAKKQGKSVIYASPEAIETVQMHRLKPLPKKPTGSLRSPLGPLAVIAYDKNAERMAHGYAPLEPLGALSRLEARITRKPKFPLRNLPILANPFAKLAIDWMPGVSAHHDFSNYAHLRRMMSHAKATKVMGISPEHAALLEKALAFSPGLLSRDLWNDWPEVVAGGSIGHLLKMAGTGT